MTESLSQLVIVCSNTSFEDNPLGAKPLALALSKNCEVIYVDPPLSYATAFKQPKLRASLTKKRFRRIGDNLYRLTPVVFPGKDRPFIHQLTSYLLKKKIIHAIKSLNNASDKKPILIATAPHYQVFTEKTFNIYWMMDDYASQPDLIGIDEKILVNGQNNLCKTADKIAVVSNSLKDTLAAQGHQSTVILNGADEEFFRFPSHEKELPAELKAKIPDEKFALYVGGVNKRIDLNYLVEVANSGTQLVIAGSINGEMHSDQLKQLLEKDNVTYLGSVENTHIPILMNLASVGLVPYADEPFNRVSMPLKIPEYLMCGLTVVSTNLPFTKAFQPDDVFSADTPQEFSNIVSEIITNPPFPSQRVMRSSRIAQDWSWNKKASEYINLTV